jgi:hypothetical protein
MGKLAEIRPKINQKLTLDNFLKTDNGQLSQTDN